MKDRNIDQLFDKMEILEMLYRYCSAADRSDPAGMLVAFTADCVVNYDPAAPIMHGRQALSDMLYSFLGAVVSGSHYINNPIFEFTGPDEVLLGCYMYSWQRFTGYPMVSDVHRWGRYEIRLERIDGAWLINHMRLISAGEYGGARIAEQMSRGPLPTLDFA